VNVGCIYRIRTILSKPPKEKIVLYVGSDYFLWFNTEARKRPAQLPVSRGECPEIIHACYLDSGRVTVFSQAELAAATDCGEANVEFITRVIEEIEVRATVLVSAHRKIVASNLRERHPIIPTTTD
jgi:hypothetical protein